jgi:ATP-binding cassette subfamily B protein/subfamily B ATP-binding cassette protein MsbA
MSNLEHDEDLAQQKLFNIDVIKLLFRYVFRYRRYLYFSLLFVALTTATTLYVPVLTRDIIDKYVVNAGYMIKRTAPDESPDYKLLNKKIVKQGILLDTEWVFINQNTLKHFSKKFIDSLRDNGILSKDKYTHVNLDAISKELRIKIDLEAADNKCIVINHHLLIPKDREQIFTVKEMSWLRASDMRMVIVLSFVILGLFAIQFGASYLQILALMKLSQNAMRDLRTDLYSHMLSLELSFYDKNPVGKLVNRVTNDIESLNEMFSSVIVNMSQNLLIMAGVVVMMFIADAYLAALVCCTIPILAVIIFIFRAQARSAYRLIRTKITELNTFLNENISGIRITQVFVQEKKQINKFSVLNKEMYRANIRQMNVYAIFRPMIDFFRWFAIATVIYFGIQSIADGRISYGLIVMFLAYIGTFFEPIGDLAEKIDILQSATAAGEKILSIFKTDARRELCPGEQIGTDVNVERFNGEIVFDNAWFAYVPGEWVLKGVSFTVKPKTTLAVVGATGSGKSTIISLLARFYVPQKGRITIDGVDINLISYETLRKNLSIVMQDVFLFSRTVKDNIILNGPWDALRYENVMRDTNAGTFVDRLLLKHDEMVMERGVTFSAGERQLLAFARSLYADPSILILDEATSNIDTHTELLIQEAIVKGIRGRTSIAIAHRLSTIRNADRIIVLEHGTVKESGTHEELIDKKGIYYELYSLQFESV